MSITTERTASAVIAKPAGRIDYDASPGFQKELESLVAQALQAGLGLVVHCAAITYVSSAGLRAFLVIARAAKSAGVDFAVSALGPAVKEVFDVSGFSTIIRVVDPDAGTSA